jgi:divalent metal cation (Fe/Co/Zn/Cd) transporter
MHIGPDNVLVGAKIELDPSLSFQQVTEAIDETEARIRAAVPTAHVIYLEPAIFDPSRRGGS